MRVRQFLLCLLSCLLATSTCAFADTVDYSTSGVFMSTGTNQTTNGGATIKFNGASASVTSPTFSGLGMFVVTATGTGTFSDSFTLTINQTLPASGMGSSSTSVDGTITGNSSTIELIFPSSPVMIGNTTYLFSPSTYGLNNPDVNGGATTIEAFITSSSTAVPEPSSLVLLGSGMVGLTRLLRRRAKR